MLVMALAGDEHVLSGGGGRRVAALLCVYYLMLPARNGALVVGRAAQRCVLLRDVC